MNQTEMVRSLRAEITKLQRVLDLLLDQQSAPEDVKRPGRPKASGDRATSFKPEEFAPAKRTMSAEGKERIAAAQKKRWAAQKRASAQGTAKTKAAASKQSRTSAPSKVRGKSKPNAANPGQTGRGAGSVPAKSLKTPVKRPAPAKTLAKKPIAKKAARPSSKTPAKQAVAAGSQAPVTE